VLAAAMLVAAINPSLRADAWARGRDATYVYLGAAALSADEAFDPSGRRIPFPGRGGEQRSLNLYVESGLTDSVTLTVNAPYERVTARGVANNFTTSGGGDLDLRLRVSHRAGPGVFALEGGAFIPLGYDVRDFPQLGSGKVEPIVNLAYGSSLGFLPEGFVSVQLGYRMRGGSLSDELPYSVKVGTFLHPRIGTFLFVRGWESRREFRGVDANYELTSADSERLSAGAEGYLRLSRALDFNMTWSRVYRGRYTAIGDEVGAGIAFHWRRGHS